MPIYFAIKDSENGPTLHVSIEEAKAIIDSMAVNACLGDWQEKYSFEAVEMTKKQFNELPEFHGF